MEFTDVSLPEVYQEESADFRFFINWFNLALTKLKYDTENLPDIYDPLRCPEDLLWLLGDTIGFKFDDRLPSAYNRLVLLYFMSLIRNKGSKNGVMLAAEVNLAQFNILEYGKENDILYNRLEDTSVPVNSVFVTPHVAEGYIDVVYFSSKRPIDACLEYVRPVGMYIFDHAGVRFDGKTKIGIDARLTNIDDVQVSIGSTHIGHYSRDDYARMQKMYSEVNPMDVNTRDKRKPVWYRNKDYEKQPDQHINPGYRALYSLQMSNNEHIVKSLMDPIFGLGYTPTDVETYDGPDVLPSEADYPRTWNLRYDLGQETESTKGVTSTIDTSRTHSYTTPKPAVAPIMNQVGDSMVVDLAHNKYTQMDDQGHMTIVDK